ncbi:glycosyltransferase [Planctomicrobium sp. SH661]|uniref:glycosyltransferase n=1 Tax=Planctomicrobium sp. SH661 TaxID=3448124 RepID=UPI003F5AF92B
MNFLLTTIGSAGDVFPMVGLAIKLRERGHTVTLATNEHFAPLARKHQIPFEPLGTQEQYLSAIQNPDLWHPQKAFAHVFSVFKTVLEKQHALFIDYAQRGPLVGISSCLGFGARMAQETHGIPLITVHLQPAVIWSDLVPPTIANLVGPRWFKSLVFRFGEKFAVDMLVGRHLNPWRKQLGLPPIRQTIRWWNSPTGVLCLFPEWYAAPQTDWPQPLMQTDFPLWNEDSLQPLPDDVARFLDAGDAPIVFTPGSANVHGQSFFETAVETCRSLKRRGILLTRHPEQIPRQLPDSVRHFSYVPLDLLLSRSAAFVHHGGIGSTSQALLAGIPQVAMPLAHDQFDNASRIEKLNVGRGLPVKKFTTKNLSNALNDLLTSQAVAEACRQTQNRLKASNGLEQSALEIEGLL